MSSKKGAPSIDPYDALGIEPGASEADITKAYRKLALKHHPDKQRNLSETEAEKVAKQFHDITEARNFLLDAEHQEDRRGYDLKRASERLRKQTEERRTAEMSERRKQMREELKQKEAMAKRGGTSAEDARRQRKRKEKEHMDQLRQEGKKMRQEYADRDLEAEVKRAAKHAKSESDTLEDRQVRLKWDRKKQKVSPSEHSIASMLSKFGVVEQVEMLGSKGNQALVTFAVSSSCRPCVDAYADSDEMRAKFVGKRKDREEELERKRDFDPTTTRVSSGREGESLNDRRLRQAAEREALLRQMAEDDVTGTSSKLPSETSRKAKSDEKAGSAPFPQSFPDTDEFRNLTDIQRLEKFEATVLGSFLSFEMLQSMKVLR